MLYAYANATKPKPESEEPYRWSELEEFDDAPAQSKSSPQLPGSDTSLSGKFDAKRLPAVGLMFWGFWAASIKIPIDNLGKVMTRYEALHARYPHYDLPTSLITRYGLRIALSMTSFLFLIPFVSFNNARVFAGEPFDLSILWHPFKEGSRQWKKFEDWRKSR